MGQSLSQMYIHLVFATKGRYPHITEDVESSLHAYMAGIFNNMESPALRINSVPDHIHVLFRLSKNHSLAKVVEIVKKDSSKWMKKKGVLGFTWQIGYGAFSVSSSGVNKVTNYINNQKAHHHKKSFHDEIGEFMQAYDEVEFDERYFYE